MKQFIREHFDKLLCTTLFLLMVHTVLALVYLHSSPDVISWARELASGFQGALLGLITGIAIGQRMLAKDSEAPKDDSK